MVLLQVPSATAVYLTWSSIRSGPLLLRWMQLPSQLIAPLVLLQEEPEMTEESPQRIVGLQSVPPRMMSPLPLVPYSLHVPGPGSKQASSAAVQAKPEPLLASAS
jgi:hypothetical protein